MVPNRKLKDITLIELIIGVGLITLGISIVYLQIPLHFVHPVVSLAGAFCVILGVGVMSPRFWQWYAIKPELRRRSISSWRYNIYEEGLRPIAWFLLLGSLAVIAVWLLQKRPVHVLYIVALVCLVISVGLLSPRTRRRWYYRCAIRTHKQALQINPGDAGTYLSLGEAYTQLDRYQEAIAAYKRAIQLEPNDAAIEPGFTAKVHYNLGAAYLALGKKDSALQQYEILKPVHQYWADQLKKLISETSR